MWAADHSIGFPVTLKLDEIVVHFGTWQSSDTARMQGLAVNFMWLCVQGCIVLQLDHDNIGTQCEGDICGVDKFGFVVAAVAAQGHVRLTVALFAVLQVSNHGSCRTSVWVPGHSIVDDFPFHTILLCGENEGDQRSIVQFHIPRGLVCEHVGPSAWSHVLQAERGVIGAERVLARLAQEEANAHHIINGKQVVVHVIGRVNVMQDGARNCDGNRLCTFGWSILLGVPSKFLAKLEVNVSVAVHSDVRGPICLCTWPQLVRHRKLSQIVQAHGWLSGIHHRFSFQRLVGTVQSMVNSILIKNDWQHLVESQ